MSHSHERVTRRPAQAVRELASHSDPGFWLRRFPDLDGPLPEPEPEPATGQRRWTDADIALLRLLCGPTRPPHGTRQARTAAIAAELGRSYESVRMRIVYAGLWGRQP